MAGDVGVFGVATIGVLIGVVVAALRDDDLELPWLKKLNKNVLN